jgi:hypothetical protein
MSAAHPTPETTAVGAELVSEAMPPAVAELAAEHRRVWAASACANLSTLDLDATDDPVRTLERAFNEDADWEAVTWLEGLDGVGGIDVVGEALGQAVSRGLRVIVAVPNTRLRMGLDASGSPPLGRDEAIALAKQLGAELVEQRLAEGSLIGTGDEQLAGHVLAQASAEPDDADAWLVCAGFDTAEAGSDARLRLSARPVHRAYLAALERANEELRLANVRLGRDQIGRHDAAAASVVGRMDTRMRELEQEVKRLTDRLELEKEVAFQNDRLFQAARAQLAAPRYRAVDAARARVLRIPGARRLTGPLLRRLIR